MLSSDSVKRRPAVIQLDGLIRFSLQVLLASATAGCALNAMDTMVLRRGGTKTLEVTERTFFMRWMHTRSCASPVARRLRRKLAEEVLVSEE